MDSCLFCRIVAGALPAEVLGRSERAIAIADIDPKAPLHALIIPVDHHPDVVDLAASDPGLLAEVIDLAARVAGARTDGQFRLVFNTGERAGQSVFHVHAHVLAGAQLGWTPA